MRAITKGVIIAGALAVFAVVALKGAAILVPTGTWAPQTNLSSARAKASAALLQDGRVLVTGGDSGSGPVATTDFFAADGTISAAPPMVNARSKHVAVTLQDGRVLVAGGVTASGSATSTAEIYDPATNSWTNVGTGMTEARSSASAALLPDGRVIIAGGQNGSSISSTIEIFDPVAGSFSFAGTMSSPRTQHAMAVLQDGRVIITGGSNGTSPVASTDIFDPVAGTISAGPSLAVARFGHSATTLLNGQVVVIGGNNGNADPAQMDLASAEMFDPAAGTFTTLAANMVTPREGHLAFLLPNNGSVLIAGGTSAGAATASAELFTPGESPEGVWTYGFGSTGSMSTARSDAAGSANQVSTPTSVMQRNGVVMVAGGNDANGNALNSTEAYGYATIQTDQSDYAPGTTVTITGSGWKPGETVNLQLVESPLIDTHGPFSAVADANGNISNSSFVTDAHDASITFTLTAAGQTSGFQAQTVFTDAVKLYEATISPTSDTAGHASAGYAITIKNDPTSTNDISSATINVPSGYSSVVLGTVTTSPAGKHWTVSLASGVITLSANAGPDHINMNQSVTLALAATAPCTVGTYTWTTATSGNFTIVGSQPAVTISGSCTVPTTLVLNSVSPNSVSFGSTGPVTFAATLTRNDTSAGVVGATVNFTVDGVTAGSTTTAAGGVAAFTTYNPSALSIGPHNVAASFTAATISGTNFGASSSGTLPLTVNKATPVITWNNPADITYGTALGATQLNASASVPGSFTYTPASGTVLSAGSSQTLHVDFTPADTTDYNTTSKDVTINVNKRDATWTTNAASKTYGDADPSPLTTGTGTNFVAADNVTATYSRAAGETVLGGPYHITATLAPAAVLSNYNITNAGADFTINARNATWTTNAASKTYGDVDPSPLTTGSGTNFVAADGVTATYTRAAGETVLGGPYHITATLAPAAVLSNYNVTNAGASFTINARNATWTTNAASKTYGDADPSPLTTGSGTNFVAADGVTATYARAAGETVLGGPYHITATLAPAAVLSNYNITNAGADFTINARNATWTTNAASKTYGDSDPTPLTTGSGTNFVAADGVTATYTRAGGETVLGGPYHITATLAPAAVLSNYNITNAGANFTINARNATWTTNAANKTYGDSDPTPLTTGSGTNFVTADGVTATYARAAGETVLGGPYHITATLAPAAVLSNYNITNAGANFTINARNATWTTNAASKTYGDSDPTPLTTGSGTNFVAADGVTATYTRAAGETVLGGPYHITATLAPAAVLSNYNITNAGADFTINARNATWTTNAASKTYGDSDPTPLTTGSGTNFVAADGVTATYTRAGGETVLGGPYHITATLAPAAVLSNYNITNAGANFTINARNAAWTTNAASKTYGDSDPTPLTTGSGTNFVAADGVTATYTRAAGETVLGGPYHITATLAPAAVLSNYNVTNAGASFAINARNATWTTNAASKTYGDVDPSPLTTGSGTNFVSADNVTATYSRAAGETVLGGPYHITATLAPAAVLSNYNITNAGADFTINARNATWTTNAASKTYGDVDPSPLTTGSGTNFVAADGVTATYTRAAGETVLGGPYHITATLAPAAVLSNYNVTNAGASFTINARNATWTTNAASKTYGDVDLSPLTTGSGTNFVSADNVTATYARAAGETVLGGPYHITATLAPAAVLSNYNITNAGADFTINARNATWTTNAASKTYGDADPSPLTTGSGTNFVSADNVTATYARAAGETVLGGPYHITATLAPAAVLSNYNITNAGADFTINTRNATWTTNAASKTYGDSDPTPLTTGSGTNFVAADGVTATYTHAAGETVLGGPYHITATLAPAAVLSNYNITNAGADFTINTRNATWTTNANSKTYGDADPSPLTTGSGTNFVAADGVTATYARAAGETVLGGPYHITATLAPAAVLSNYNITNAGASFAINVKTVTPSVTASDKPYDGTKTATITACTVSPKVGTDDVACVAGSATFASANASPTAQTVTAIGILLTGVTAPNYVLSSNTAATMAHINPAPTSTSVTSSVNSSVFGQPVTFSATVSNTATSPTPTGSVQFIIDGSNFVSPVPVAGSGGTATAASMSTTTLSVGVHNVVAAYTNSDGNFIGSTSSTFKQQVNYGFLGLQSPYMQPPTTFNVKRTMPLKWQYTNSGGAVVNSASANPVVMIQGPYACGGTDSSGDIIVNDAGASGYQYDPTTNTWQFNWQIKGNMPGCYDIFIKSQQSGQTNGAFPISVVNK